MTPDDPDLSELRAALDAAIPRPDPAVRAAHLRLAQENFERLQAKPLPSLPARAWRLAAMLGALTGRGGLTAATMFVAFGVLVLTPTGQDLWQRPFAPIEREETAAAPEPPAAPEVTPSTAATGPAAAPQAESNAEAAEDAQTALTPATATAVAAGAANEPTAPQAENAAPDPRTLDARRTAPEAPTVGATAMAEASRDALAGKDAAGLDASALADSAAAGGAPEAREPARPDAYAALRRSLREGRLPATVQVGDLVDGVPYDLPAPGAGPLPTVSVLATPWNPATRLVVIQLPGAAEPFQKLQAEVEWNPATVADSRPVGDATAASLGGLRLEAGLGAGQTVTALFEVTPAGDRSADASDLGTLWLRWTDAASGASRLLEVPITGREPAGTETRFAAALAHWGLLLRGEAEGWDAAIALAESARGPDPSGLRAGAIDLMRLSQRLAR